MSEGNFTSNQDSYRQILIEAINTSAIKDCHCEYCSRIRERLTALESSVVETSPKPVAWMGANGVIVSDEHRRSTSGSRAAYFSTPLYAGSPVETSESPALGETCPQHGWYRLNAAGCPVCHHEKQQAHSSGKAEVPR